MRPGTSPATAPARTRFKDFNPGVRAEVERNPNHYRDDEGWFDSAELLNIQDQAARTTALRSDEVDVINRPDPKTTHLLAKVPGVKVVETPGNQHYTMPMRMDTDPFTDMHVRQAVKHAIPRQEFLDKILNGYGYLGNDHPIGKGQVYFNDNLPQRTFDPDKAKWHLGQAGRSSLDIELFAADTAWTGGARRGTARPGVRQERRDQHQGHPRGQGRILVGDLAQEALVLELLGRAPDRGLDVQRHLLLEVGVERYLHEARFASTSCCCGLAVS